MNMKKSIIVAMADNNAIGKDNELLWHISEDLKFFKKKTLGCPVIMGRKTFESIGKALPQRKNIVISRSKKEIEGVSVVNTFSEGYSLAKKVCDETQSKRCFIIGGGEMYAQAIKEVDELIVTHVHHVFESADTFFPKIDKNEWKERSRSEMQIDEKSGYKYEFVEYIRKGK